MKKQTLTQKLKSRMMGSKEAFTLVEMMIAASVAGLVTMSTLGLFSTNYQIGFVNQERNRINADIRRFTGLLIRDGREANYFMIYKSIFDEFRDDVTDRQLDGDSGDLLVFVQTESTENVTKPTLIKGIIAYYRASDADDPYGLAPVRRYEKTFDHASDQTLENVLPDLEEFLNGDEVIELSRGLADGRLFYNFWGRSVMINGQIHHGNEAKRVTETYNFTVSPRG